jgi:transcriptional regulator with XRE-family HTH domain
LPTIHGGTGRRQISIHCSSPGNSSRALRIAKGVSQRDLAERVGVHESQVSRDERNEYHGVTVERANRVLETLGVEVRCVVESLEKVPA